MLLLVTFVIPATLVSINSAMMRNTARSPRTWASKPPAMAPSGLVPQATSR